jgi:hypothetical protein
MGNRRCVLGSAVGDFPVCMFCLLACCAAVHDTALIPLSQPAFCFEFESSVLVLCLASSCLLFIVPTPHTANRSGLSAVFFLVAGVFTFLVRFGYFHLVWFFWFW